MAEHMRAELGDAVTEDEARELYNTFAVPAAGAPLFQAATANLNPWNEVKVRPCLNTSGVDVFGDLRESTDGSVAQADTPVPVLASTEFATGVDASVPTFVSIFVIASA